jgi:hypothetical protein
MSNQTGKGEYEQYIIVAVSGGNYSGDYIAYSLPSGN